MFSNIRPKFDLKNHKDILQLKFFIISYVNSLERRKCFTVIFFHPGKNSCAKLFVDEENVRCACISDFKCHSYSILLYNIN